MRCPLNHTQISLLRELDPVAGTPTKMLAHHMCGPTPRHRSGLAVYELNYLCGRGLVDRMDDQKPVAWVITQKGAAALEADAKP